jgi:hypothetical protein
VSDYFIEYPPLDDLYRMKRSLERDFGEYEYDLNRNERRRADILREMKNVKDALISVQAYIDKAKEGES